MHFSKLFTIPAASALLSLAIADPPTTQSDPVADNIYDTCNNMIDMINGLVKIAKTIKSYSALQYKALSTGPYAVRTTPFLRLNFKILTTPQDILAGFTVIESTIAAAGSIITPIANNQEQQAYIQDCIAIVWLSHLCAFLPSLTELQVVISNRKLYDTLICKAQASFGSKLSSIVPGAIVKYDGATYVRVRSNTV